MLFPGSKGFLKPPSSGAAAPAPDPYEPPSIQFSAVKSVDQTFSSATFTKATFPTEEYDDGGGYDAANSKFVAPVDGLYLFHAGISADGTFTGTDLIAYYKNGSAYRRTQQISVSANIIASSLQIKLDAGDYVEIYFYAASGATVVDADSVATYFMGALIREIPA